MMSIMLPNVHSTESGMDLTIKANKNSDTISITGFISNNENDVTFKAILIVNLSQKSKFLISNKMECIKLKQIMVSRYHTQLNLV
jgi:hypothetical protein